MTKYFFHTAHCDITSAVYADIHYIHPPTHPYIHVMNVLVNIIQPVTSGSMLPVVTTIAILQP